MTTKTVPIEQSLAEKRRADQRSQELFAMLIPHAREQERIEHAYNDLVVIAKLGIDFLQAMQFGEVISDEWITQRDALVERCERAFLDDTSN